MVKSLKDILNHYFLEYAIQRPERCRSSRKCRLYHENLVTNDLTIIDKAKRCK